MRTFDPTKLAGDECQGIQINGLDHCQLINCKWQGLSACQGHNIIKTGINAHGFFVGKAGLAK